MKLRVCLFLLPICLEAVAGTGDWWRDLPEGKGVLIGDGDSDWIQSLKFGGYAHLQSAFVDGRADREDFQYSRKFDWRRARGVIKGRALEGLTFSTHLNLVQDEGRTGGGVEFDYFSIFSAEIALDLARWFEMEGVDSLQIGYGKRKLTELSEEMDTSINSLLTVERSALAGQLVPFREGTAPTGAWAEIARGDGVFSLGIFTTDSSREFGNWDEGRIFLAGWRQDFSQSWGLDEATLSLALAWQDAGANEELYSQWEWVAVTWMRIGDGRWGLRTSAAIGKNEALPPDAEGSFLGLVIAPSYWLVPDRLQAVARYQVMASEGPEDLRLPSRYAREAGLPGNEGIPALAKGAGDFHQSLYGGLVWRPVGKHLEVLTGLEWERLESADRNVYDGITGWFSTRLIF